MATIYSLPMKNSTENEIIKILLITIKIPSKYPKINWFRLIINRKK